MRVNDTTKEMSLVDALMSNHSSEKNTTNNNFQSVFEAAEKTQEPKEPSNVGTKTVQPHEADKTKETDKHQKEPVKKESAKKDAPPQKEETNATTPEKTKTSETAAAPKAQKSTKTDEKKPVELTEAEQVALEQVAAIVDLPQEVVVEILASMNISVLELAVPENMTEFAQKVFEVETPAELLTVPNAIEVLKPLQELAETFKPALEKFAAELVDLKETNEFTNVLQSAILSAESPKKEVVTGKEVVQQEVAAVNVEQPKEAPKTEEVVVVNKEEKSLTVNTVTQRPVEVEEETSSLGEETQQQSTNTPDKQSQTAVQPTVAAVVNRAAETPNVEAVEAEARPISVGGVGNVRTAAMFSRMQTVVARPVNQAEVISQIMERLKVEVKSDMATEVKITLKPEHLGDVTMKIVTQNGIVTAQFTAENQRVKEVIEAGFADLKERLKEQGVNISQLSVSVGQDDSADERTARYRAETVRNISRISSIREAEIETQQPTVRARDGSLVDYIV